MLDGAGEEGIGGEVVGEEARSFRFMMMRVILTLICDDCTKCLKQETLNDAEGRIESRCLWRNNFALRSYLLTLVGIRKRI